MGRVTVGGVTGSRGTGKQAFSPGREFFSKISPNNSPQPANIPSSDLRPPLKKPAQTSFNQIQREQSTLLNKE